MTNGDRLKRLASWILTSKKTQISARHITRNVRPMRGMSIFDLNRHVSPLVAAGWLQPADRTPVNSKWTVNSVVAVQFAAQRKIEDERKDFVAKLMGSPRKSTTG
jgi:hypothetical protein